MTLNGVLQDGSFKIDSPSHVVTKSRLLASLEGIDEFHEMNLKGKTFNETVTTSAFNVPVNQDVRLEVEFEVTSTARGTAVCSQAHGLFENGIGFPIGGDVFSGVPSNIDVRSDDLFLRENRWGPVLAISPLENEVVVSWPSLLTTNMVLESASISQSPLQWAPVETTPVPVEPLLQISFPKSLEPTMFRLKEETP